MLTKTVIGAVVGAMFAIVWATIGFGWAWVVLVVATLGGVIGYLLDRPGRAIELLERFDRRR